MVGIRKEDGGKKIMQFYRMEGVRDLTPMKARGAFAKALMLEDEAGQTTPDALAQLELAILATEE